MNIILSRKNYQLFNQSDNFLVVDDSGDIYIATDTGGPGGPTYHRIKMPRWYQLWLTFLWKFFPSRAVMIRGEELNMWE